MRKKTHRRSIRLGFVALSDCAPIVMAQELGLFAKLGVFLLAFKKVIIGAVIALGAGLFKFFGKKKDQTI